MSCTLYSGILTFALLFQSETLKYIRNKYCITNSDFKVLSAARLYQLSNKSSFRPYQLSKYLKGMWSEQIYKSFRNLIRKEMIATQTIGKHKIYNISQKGDKCLRAYSAVFNSVLDIYSEADGEV